MHNESRSKFKVQRLKAIDWSLLHVINDVVEEVETSKTVASPSSERMYDSIWLDQSEWITNKVDGTQLIGSIKSIKN